MLRLFMWLWRWSVTLWRGVATAVRGAPATVDELLDMRRIIAGMFPILLIAFAMTLAICGKSWARGAIWCLSCLAVGAAAGFLFGIPKVLQGDTKVPFNPASGAALYRQRVNTNLEEISDWLTKIIVGLGLIHLTEVPARINSIAVLFAGSIEQTAQQAQQHGVFGAVIVFFLVAGFLFGYLITRLFLQGALGRADRAAAFPDEGALPKRVATKPDGAQSSELPTNGYGETHGEHTQTPPPEPPEGSDNDK